MTPRGSPSSRTLAASSAPTAAAVEKSELFRDASLSPAREPCLQRLQALRVDAVIVGDKNSFHELAVYCRRYADISPADGGINLAAAPAKGCVRSGTESHRATRH